MRFVSRAATVGLALTVWCAAASGASYVVDQSKGDDAAAGGEAAPWKTVGKGVAALKAGDTLVIGDGPHAAPRFLGPRQVGVGLDLLGRPAEEVFGDHRQAGSLGRGHDVLEPAVDRHRRHNLGDVRVQRKTDALAVEPVEAREHLPGRQLPWFPPQSADAIKLELSANDLLADDFPEVCHAVRALEGKVQCCHSQTHGGRLTHIEWTADAIVLPTIFEGQGDKARPTAASGAIIKPVGITAATRGMKHATADGLQPRPDFVIIDDPQIDESAASPHQVRNPAWRSRFAAMRLPTSTLIEPPHELIRPARTHRGPMKQMLAADTDEFNGKPKHAQE